MIQRGSAPDGYINQQIDRLQAMYVDNLIGYGLEEARADTFMFQALQEMNFSKTQMQEVFERASYYLTQGSGVGGGLTAQAAAIGNRFGFGQGLIPMSLIEEAAHRGRATYLGAIGYGEMESVLGSQRKDFITGTAFNTGQAISEQDALNAFSEQFNKTASQGRYEVRFSSGQAKNIIEELAQDTGAIRPSTKAGSRSAKTFIGIAQAKNTAMNVIKARL